MFIFSVSYPPVRAFSDSGRRLRPRTEQRSCRSVIPAKLSARWQKNAVQRHGARHFVTRLKSGFRGARRTRGCSQSGDLRFFAAFWSAVNRGLGPRKLMYFLTAKSTKNSPADASAYFVPSNVRNGRLFAGLQANRPRFLPLLAGTSFRGSGIGPGPFAAVLSFRPGKEANTRTKDVRPCSRVRMFAQNRTENRTESEPKLPAAMRIPVLNRARVSSTPSRRVP